MFSRFFIDRPIFASVLSIVITLSGGIAMFALPVTQYPEITPPTVEVSAVYPGANSKVVSDTVAAPIEQQVNGVEDMMYMSSQCTNDGNYSLTVTFRPGTDLNLAQVLVQNRVNLAQAILPDLVKRRGVMVKKKSPSTLMIVNLYSPGNSRDSLYLSNYATIQLRDELSRLPGVGDITFLGRRDYSMRIWLDPNKLASRNLTAGDVAHTIEQQNLQVAAGQIGQPPAPNGQVFQYTMTTTGRLQEEVQFEEMVIRSDDQGRLIRLRDVARAELGALAYDQACTLDGQPSVALSVYQLPGSNALETAKLVKQKMEELRSRFPEGVDYKIVYDTTPFIEESITEVFHSLRDAVILVAVVVLIFLQGWRPAIIPLVAVPVAVVGTFAVMIAAGFSLNTLTLFGLVLAIGIVVDDAIVVVEAVEHHIEEGMSPRDAAIRAMDEVSGPVIAVGLVLSAVFLPCAFISGIVGQFFRQFALTIAISTVISAFNSLTLSPALSVLLLRPRSAGLHEALPRPVFWIVGAWLGYEYLPALLAAYVPARELPAPLTFDMALRAGSALVGAFAGFLVAGILNRILGWTFSAFNIAFNWFTRGYVRAVGLSLRVSLILLAVYGFLVWETYHSFQTTPTGFIPAQDKGYLLVNLRLPDSKPLGRTIDVIKQIEEKARQVPGVNHTVAIAGQSILLNANAPNFGTIYVMLADFHERSKDGLSGEVVADKLREAFASIQDGDTSVFHAPAIEGLGTAGGFKLVVEDRSDLGLATLQQVSENMVKEGAATPELQGLFTSFRADTKWQFLDIDRVAAKSRGVSVSDVFETLQIYFGSLYVNDFNRFGRTWQVNLQADAKFRGSIEDLKLLKVRNSEGHMVPLGTLAHTRETQGPLLLYRYNLYPAAAINLDAAPGTSSGEAIEKMQEVADRTLAPSMRREWTELALLQLGASDTAMYAFGLAVVLVFLVLAAQYESWALPLAVILVVPMCLLCSIFGVRMAKMDVNIFTQIGFVVLVGLACKNAILIVEFARAKHDAGMGLREATLEACRLRLRPIVMTSFAFILGVVPLVIGEGAGAEMRRTLGTAVFSGMLGVTIFGIVLTPVFFYVIQYLVDLRGPRTKPEDEADVSPTEHAPATALVVAPKLLPSPEAEPHDEK
ncbi:MAG: multidrug efflux RND transporter permease subunit [Planctomycetia bacterium]|nr:multidrug efflux RND transporter permease subunit [Planctomycetia bacterium]